MTINQFLPETQSIMDLWNIFPNVSVQDYQAISSWFILQHFYMWTAFTSVTYCHVLYIINAVVVKWLHYPHRVCLTFLSLPAVSHWSFLGKARPGKSRGPSAPAAAAPLASRTSRRSKRGGERTEQSWSAGSGKWREKSVTTDGSKDIRMRKSVIRRHTG